MTHPQTPGLAAPAPAGMRGEAHPADQSPSTVAGTPGPVDGLPALTITVYGEPAGQGNLRKGAHGKSYHANGKTLRPWRAKVRTAAFDATGGHEWVAYGDAKYCARCNIPEDQHALLLGAVALDAIVTVPALKKPRPHPITRSTSDWDHYGRALGDALTGAIYLDDSQIIDGRVRVTYPGPSGLDQPGALIRVWEITP